MKKMIYAVGIGPGDLSLLAPAAKDAITNSAIVVGYHTYVDLIQGLIDKQEVISTGMMGEVERCQQAIDKAKEGNVVSVISSGDAGIFGMAGLLFELMENEEEQIPIEVIPGITAANAAAAVLGSPLMNDFAIISLSDLLTPKEVIEKRITCLAGADMVCAVYNPASKKRRDLIAFMMDLFKAVRGADTVCGYVKNAAREEQSKWVGTIGDFPFDDIDMTTIVIIGNSQTVVINDKMVTCRGYQV